MNLVAQIISTGKVSYKMFDPASNLPDVCRSLKPSAKSGSSISLYITTAKKQTGIREECARSPSTKETSQMMLDENTQF